jgi:GNAT superfamily N-acetyltransferase
LKVFSFMWENIMNQNQISIESFDRLTADEAGYRAFHQLINQIRAERLPDDPPQTFAQTEANLQSVPPFVNLHIWLVWDAAVDQAVAHCQLVYTELEENKHIAQFDLAVLPQYRRQGIARRLLALAAAVALQANRRLLIAETNGRIPAGQLFMERLAAMPGLHVQYSQLDLATVDRALLRQWIMRSIGRLYGAVLQCPPANHFGAGRYRRFPPIPGQRAGTLAKGSYAGKGAAGTAVSPMYPHR